MMKMKYVSVRYGLRGRPQRVARSFWIKLNIHEGIITEAKVKMKELDKQP